MTKTELKSIYHRLFSWQLRYKVDQFPYLLSYNRFIKKMDLNNLPLFEYIEIETINRCNGKCSFCPVNINQPQRKYAMMEDHLFYKIINELSDINYKGNIALFSNNEPFLDKRISDFCMITRKKVPKSKITLSTNGILLTKEKFDAIIPYIDSLIINNYSDDGVIQDSVRQLDKYIKSNKILRKKVIIDIRKENEELTTRGGQAPNMNKSIQLNRNMGCFYPFKQMVIRPTGKCSLCCNDALGVYDLGDVNHMSLKEIWYSAKYMCVRKKMRRYGREGLKLCNKCDTHNFT